MSLERLHMGLQRRWTKWSRAALVYAWKRYRRLVPPPLSSFFEDDLWTGSSPFDRLVRRYRDPVADADRIAAYAFRVFSRELTFPDGEVEWQKDFYTGLSYPPLPYPLLDMSPDRGRDITVPWELSRLQFIPALIRAHQVTRNERYSRFFKTILTNWMQRNPYLIGVNWATGMEVAIRGVNLLLGLSYFSRYGALDEPVWPQLLWGHLEYLHDVELRHIPKVRNNHFLISSMGLMALGLCFSGTKAAARFECGRRHLNQEILRQFRPDGGHFESANHYHQLSLEAALIGQLFQNAAAGQSSFGRREDPDIAQRLQNGLRLISDYQAAFGCSPQFGDSSDGRILLFSDYFCSDALAHGFMRVYAEELFPDEPLFQDAVVRPVYPDSGYGFYSNERYGLCLNATPVDHDGHGGHNHCDKTSYVLRVGGQPVITDSGSYGYSHSLRRRFCYRRSRAHNLVVVDGHEQGELSADQWFGAPAGIDCRLEHRGEAECEVFILSHSGYCRIPGLDRIERRVTCYASRLVIEEFIAGTGVRDIEICHHLHPDLRAVIQRSEVLLAKGAKRLCVLTIPQQFSATLQSAYHSPAYLEEIPNQVVSLLSRLTLPVRVAYEIRVASPA